MSGNVLTYDPASVTINIAGWIVPGVVSVGLQWQSEVFAIKKGIRGQHTRVYNPDRYAILNIELLPTSIANDVFSEIVRQDSQTFSSLLTPLALKDSSGTSQFSASQAYIHSYPEMSFNAEGVTTRKWEIEILSFDSTGVTIGGNATNGIDIADILNGAMTSAKDLVSDGMAAVANYF